MKKIKFKFKVGEIVLIGLAGETMKCEIVECLQQMGWMGKRGYMIRRIDQDICEYETSIFKFSEEKEEILKLRKRVRNLEIKKKGFFRKYKLKV